MSHLTHTTTPGQRRPVINDNKGALYIPENSRTEASPSDGLVSYPWHSLKLGSYPYAEMQLAYSTTPADWANKKKKGIYVGWYVCVIEIKSDLIY